MKFFFLLLRKKRSKLSFAFELIIFFKNIENCQRYDQKKKRNIYRNFLLRKQIETKCQLESREDEKTLPSAVYRVQFQLLHFLKDFLCTETTSQGKKRPTLQHIHMLITKFQKHNFIRKWASSMHSIYSYFGEGQARPFHYTDHIGLGNRPHMYNTLYVR